MATDGKTKRKEITRDEYRNGQRDAGHETARRAARDRTSFPFPRREMETVPVLERDAGTSDKNLLKTMSENLNHETDFQFRQANCYMLSINTTLHLEGHARDE